MRSAAARRRSSPTSLKLDCRLAWRRSSTRLEVAAARLPEESEHPFRNRLIEDIVVKRVEKLLPMRSALEKIQDLSLYPMGYDFRPWNAATSKRGGGLTPIFH